MQIRKLSPSRISEIATRKASRWLIPESYPRPKIGTAPWKEKAQIIQVCPSRRTSRKVKRPESRRVVKSLTLLIHIWWPIVTVPPQASLSLTERPRRITLLWRLRWLSKWMCGQSSRMHLKLSYHKVKRKRCSKQQKMTAFVTKLLLWRRAKITSNHRASHKGRRSHCVFARIKRLPRGLTAHQSPARARERLITWSPLLKSSPTLIHRKRASLWTVSTISPMICRTRCKRKSFESTKSTFSKTRAKTESKVET